MKQTQSTAILGTDILFRWPSTEPDIDCQCRLRIYQRCFDQVVVIVSLLPDSPKAVNSEIILHLIHQVNRRFSLVPHQTMWLEHFPAVAAKKHQECYFQISLLGQHRLYWNKISIEQIQSLLGQVFCD